MFQWLDEKVKAILNKAHEESICEETPADVNTFMESSTSFVKGSTIELKRNICDFNQLATPLRFWRKGEDGTFVRFYPTEIPVDSIVVVSMYPRMYNFREKSSNKVKYGVVGDLGEDIIVVWMPKPRTSEEIQEEMQAKRDEIKKKLEEEEESNTAAATDTLEDIYLLSFKKEEIYHIKLR